MEFGNQLSWSCSLTERQLPSHVMFFLALGVYFKCPLNFLEVCLNIFLRYHIICRRNIPRAFIVSLAVKQNSLWGLYLVIAWFILGLDNVYNALPRACSHKSKLNMLSWLDTVNIMYWPCIVCASSSNINKNIHDVIALNCHLSNLCSLFEIQYWLCSVKIADFF